MWSLHQNKIFPLEFECAQQYGFSPLLIIQYVVCVCVRVRVCVCVCACVCEF